MYNEHSMENKKDNIGSQIIEGVGVASDIRYGAKMVEQGCNLHYNYSNIDNLKSDIHFLQMDFDRLLGCLDARQRCGLPVSQEDINQLKLIQRMIEQKISQKIKAHNQIDQAYKSIALETGVKILEKFLMSKLK